MNEIQIFQNEDFGEVRTITRDGEPWFVAADVCRALDIEDTGKATNRLDEDELTRIKIGSGGQNREMIIVNEPGLYSLVLGSRKPEARAFKRWITHDVIPSIRRNGGYIAGQDTLTDDELFARALLVAQNKIRERDNLIAKQTQIIGELQPKASYYDTILNNRGLVTITQIAKDYGMSGKQMNQLLAERGVQYKQSGQWLLYSAHHNKGWTHSKTIDITRSDGSPDVVMETKWTSKGRLAIYELLKADGILPVIERETA